MLNKQGAVQRSDNKQSPVRLIIVDDHETLRNTLGLFLSEVESVELVGEAGSGEEALAACERFRPDVVLMDILMPGMDGLLATRAIRREHPEVSVIGMTGMEHERMKSEVLQAGASDFIYKGALSQELLDAIAKAVVAD